MILNQSERDALRKWMDETGLSLPAVGQILDVGKSTVHQWLNGGGIHPAQRVKLLEHIKSYIPKPLESKEKTPQPEDDPSHLMTLGINHIAKINECGYVAISTGYVNLDYVLRGLKNGHLVVLASHPANGKSTLAMNIALNIAQSTQNCPSAIFSLDMDKARLGARLIYSDSQVSEKDADNQLSTLQIKKMVASSDKMKGKIRVDDSIALTLPQCQEKGRQMKEMGVGFIVVDGLPLMRGSRPYESRDDEVAEICAGLKNLARELNLPILLVANLKGPPSWPRLPDLRHADAINEYADVILLLGLHEDFSYEPIPGSVPNQILADLIVAKNRDGITGKIQLLLNPEYHRFDNLPDKAQTPT